MGWKCVVRGGGDSGGKEYVDGLGTGVAGYVAESKGVATVQRVFVRMGNERKSSVHLPYTTTDGFPFVFTSPYSIYECVGKHTLLRFEIFRGKRSNVGVDELSGENMKT